MKFIHTPCSTKQLQLLRAQLGMPWYTTLKSPAHFKTYQIFAKEKKEKKNKTTQRTETLSTELSETENSPTLLITAKKNKKPK